MSLYKENLLDHYKNPRHHGEVEGATFKVVEDNPLCGDSITMSGIVAEGTLQSVAFMGKGCVISQAAASILLEKCSGLQVDAIMAFTADDMLELLQMQFGPNRLKCALLALVALQKGLGASEC